mmetsp:Transcript_47834/g.104114  ORF Transcript_47834/g.104114 Transcript_47834/m.104114 type:complete len:224 (-) Transcript_47834:116-787(-)
MASFTRMERPSMQEMPRLQSELQVWIARSRYQLQEADRMPINRLHNTSMTLATGAGAASFFAVKRFRPGLAFPWDIVPGFVLFYITHRVAHRVQLPTFYDDLFASKTPLGFRSREILTAIRGGGSLPSHELEGSLQPGQQGMSSSGSGSASYDDARDIASSTQWSPEPQEALPPDPWGDISVSDSLQTSDGWQESGKSSEPAGRKRTSWEEIRMRNQQANERQ